MVLRKSSKNITTTSINPVVISVYMSTTLGVGTHSPPRALHVQMAGGNGAHNLPSTEGKNIYKYANKDKGQKMICSRAIDTCKYCEALSAPPKSTCEA